MNALEVSAESNLTAEEPPRGLRRVSVSDLSRLTGFDRATVAKRIDGLAFEPGAKGARIYDSAEALPRIYATNPKKISLDEARTRQALSQEALNKVREEELRKKRIPIEIVSDVYDQVLQSMVKILKSSENKVLTFELTNELLAGFRDIPNRLNW